MAHNYKSDKIASEVLTWYKQYLRMWPVRNDQLYIPTREGETFVVASGPTCAPALVLLHGAMSNTTGWMLEAATLANEFRVYAVDVIGDAGLSAPSRPSFATDAFALWLSDVFDGLGIHGASVVGLSMGGGLALDLAIRMPTRVDSLVLICPAGVANKNILWWALPLLLLGPWGSRKFNERMVGKMPEDLPEEARHYAEFANAIYKGLRPRKEGPANVTDDQLSELSMPVLVLLGGKDVTVDSELIKQRFEHYVASSKVVIYPEARHYLGDQSAAIVSFLRTVYTDAPEGRNA